MSACTPVLRLFDKSRFRLTAPQPANRSRGAAAGWAARTSCVVMAQDGV